MNPNPSRPRTRRQNAVYDFADVNKIIIDVMKEGFPPDISRAFVEEADASEDEKIIICRNPGIATLRLNHEGYDVKGFHIKAKSCDWGSMAGFLCKNPLFNKAGIEKFEFNLLELIKYKKYLNAGFLNDNLSEIKKSYGLKETEEMPGLDPFMQISVTGERVKELIKLETLPKDAYEVPSKLERIDINHNNNLIKLKERVVLTGIRYFKKRGSDERIYVFHSSDKPKVEGEYIKGTIAAIFCMIGSGKPESGQEASSKEPQGNGNDPVKPVWPLEALVYGNDAPNPEPEGFWKLYHGPVRLYDGEKWKTYNGLDDFPEITEKIEDKDKEIAKELCSFNAGINESIKLDLSNCEIDETIFDEIKKYGLEFFPVYGICNPESCKQPISKRDVRSTVTGDYDLFAVWPLQMVPNNYLRGYLLNRVSDKEGKLKWEYSPVNAAAVRVDFIPHFDEIKLLEDTEIGNYNNYGKDVLESLNVRAKNYDRKFPIAMHSDEGGRPGEKFIDLPLVAFYPLGRTSDIGTANSAFTVINNLVDFVNFLDKIRTYIKSKGEIRFEFIFNHCWVSHMFMVFPFGDYRLVDQFYDSRDDLMLPYFNEAENKLKNLDISPNEFKSLRMKVLELFFDKNDAQMVFSALFEDNGVKAVKSSFYRFVESLVEYTLFPKMKAGIARLTTEVNFKYVMLEIEFARTRNPNGNNE